VTFADTAYFLELLNPQDEWHEAAVRWSQTGSGPLVTNSNLRPNPTFICQSQTPKNLPEKCCGTSPASGQKFATCT